MHKSKAEGKGRFKQTASSHQAQQYLQQSLTSPSFGNAFAAAAFSLPADLASPTASSPSASSTAPAPSFALRDAVDSPDPQLNFIVKKLNKRDPVTKLKALDDLTAHLTSLPDPASSLLPLLPAYVHAYCRLYADNDRRVREALYPSLSFVLTHCRKQAAPYLKQLFPCWWSHQHEGVREVMRAARAVWQTVFSAKEREMQVLLFVRAEYCAWVEQTLTATVQSLSDVAVVGMEAAVEAYDRVVSSALLGLATFLDTIPQADNDEHAVAFGALLTLAVRHLSSKRAVIRRAVYVLLFSAVTHQPTYVQSQLSTLSSLLFDVISEREKANLSAMWDVLLHFLRTFPDAVSFLPAEPKRWRNLLRAVEQGGHGNSGLLYSHLLPLLSTLPAASTSPAFFVSLFSALYASRLSNQDAASTGSSAASASAAAEAMPSCYLECCLYEVVSKKRQRVLVSHTVLYDIMLPFIQQQLLAPDQGTSTKHFRQAGKSLTVIERHVAAGADDDAGKAGAEQAVVPDAGDDQARSSFFSVSHFYFQLHETCVIALEGAERQEKEAAQQLAGDADGAGGGDNAARRKRSAWQTVEELVSAMQAERTAHRPKPASDDSKVEQPSATASSVDPLHTLAAGLFLHALAVFTRSRSVSALHFAHRLVQSFSLTGLLAAAQPAVTSNSFLTTQLLPLLPTCLSPTALHSTPPSDFSALASPFLSLLADGMLAGGYGEAEITPEQRQTLDAMMHTVLSAAPTEGSDDALVCWLVVLRLFLSRIVRSVPSCVGSAELDDGALSLAEALLTSTSALLCSHYADVFPLLLPLLSSATAEAVLSSFLEALSAFVALSGHFPAAAVEAKAFSAQSGASVTSLPSVLSIMSPYLSKPSMLPAAPAGTVDTSQTSESFALLSSLLTAFFFLQFSPDAAVSSRARQEWQRMETSERERHPPAFASMAAIFCSSLLTAPIASMTSAFILGWAEQARHLVSSLTSPSARQLVLSALLPSHDALMQLIRQDGEEERLRVVRDCVSELIRGVGADELLSERLWLAADLLAMEQHFPSFTTTPAHALDPTRDLMLALTSFLFPASTAASPVPLSSLMALVLQSSLSAGGPYSSTLKWLLQQAESHAITLSPPAAHLFIRSVLLPLTGQSESTTGVLPTSFSTLLPALASSLPRTLTQLMEETITAFAGSPATYLAVKPVAGRGTAAALPPQLEVLVRALMAEAERLCSKAPKTDSEVLYLSSVLASLAAIMHGAAAVPSWVEQRTSALLLSLPALPVVAKPTWSRYLFGRAQLWLLAWRWLGSATTASSQPAPAVAPGSTRKALLATVDETLRFALSGAVTQEQRQAASSFAYLQPTVQLLHSTLPALMSDASSLSLNLVPAMTAAYDLLSSPLLTLLSVTRLEATLSLLSSSVVHYLRHTADALNLLLAKDFSPTGASSSTSLSLSAPSFPPSSRLSRLFALLAHPFPSVSLHARELLSICVLYRGVTSDVVMEEDSLAVVKTDLRDDGEVDDSADDERKSTRADDAEGEEGGKKEARRRKRRLLREKVRVRDNVSLLLPPQLQALLESRLDTDDGVSSAQPSAAPALFAGSSLADQVKGYLLAFSVLLDLLELQLPLSSSALADGKRALLVSYLRDYDCFSPFLSELTEHILVASTSQQREAWLELLKSTLRTTVTEEMLWPVAAREEEEVRVTAALRRSHQLQQLEAVLSFVDDAVFLPQLACVLYLRALHQLPALSRAWWTNTDRLLSTPLQRMTAQHFSPLLITHELSEVAAQPPPAPVSEESTSTLTIATNPSASVLTARYTAGEVQMSLILRLQPSHPLLPIAVEFGDAVRVQQGWLRRWQLSVASALLSSNGGLHGAVLGWWRNVEQHFAGVQECPICYAVLHSVHLTLPRMTCRVCNNRFHSVCLFSWFEKSGQSTCPMCRTTF